MAIPKSTFVMGVVTLGLFGVAIYETSRGKHERARDSEIDEWARDDSDEEAMADRERIEAERAKLVAEEQAADAKRLEGRKAGLRALVGAEVAMPGPLFAGMALDGPANRDAMRERLSAFTRDTTFAVDLGTARTYESFSIRPDESAWFSERDELCGELHTLIGTAWGSAYLDDDGAELWTNKLTGVRAWFKRSSCNLVFERYDEPAAWLDASASSTVPLSWLGKPANVVRDALGTTDSENVVEWTAHGVGAGIEATSLTATIENGKVARIAAQTFANAPTRAALEEHLRRTFGPPKAETTRSGDVSLEWPAPRLHVVLADNGAVVVTIGTP